MQDNHANRIRLRRETHDFNEELAALVDRLESLDPEAASAVRQARKSLFEAWTILCVPPEEEDDH